jgi:hypothetical protein
VTAPTTTVAVKTPAASAGELVTALYAALNARDDAAFRALSTADAHHVVYWAGTSSAGIQSDFAHASYWLTYSGIQSIEVLGEPIVSGATITVPVRYHYVEGPYIGFDVIVTAEVPEGLLITGGATLLADQAVALDPTAIAVIEAEHTAWNDGDADGVVATFAADAMVWDDLADPEATYTGDALAEFVLAGLGFNVEITAEPLFSGPFIALPNRRVAPTDVSDGISIYLVRDGNITLQGFAQ